MIYEDKLKFYKLFPLKKIKYLSLGGCLHLLAAIYIDLSTFIYLNTFYFHFDLCIHRFIRTYTETLIHVCIIFSDRIYGKLFLAKSPSKDKTRRLR